MLYAKKFEGQLKGKDVPLSYTVDVNELNTSTSQSKDYEFKLTMSHKDTSQNNYYPYKIKYTVIFNNLYENPETTTNNDTTAPLRPISKSCEFIFEAQETEKKLAPLNHTVNIMNISQLDYTIIIEVPKDNRKVTLNDIIYYPSMAQQFKIDINYLGKDYPASEIPNFVISYGEIINSGELKAAENPAINVTNVKRTDSKILVKTINGHSEHNMKLWRYEKNEKQWVDDSFKITINNSEIKEYTCHVKLRDDADIHALETVIATGTKESNNTGKMESNNLNIFINTYNFAHLLTSFKKGVNTKICSLQFEFYDTSNKLLCCISRQCTLEVKNVDCLPTITNIEYFTCDGSKIAKSSKNFLYPYKDIDLIKTMRPIGDEYLNVKIGTNKKGVLEKYPESYQCDKASYYQYSVPKRNWLLKKSNMILYNPINFGDALRTSVIARLKELEDPITISDNSGYENITHFYIKITGALGCGAMSGSIRINRGEKIDKDDQDLYEINTPGQFEIGPINLGTFGERRSDQVVSNFNIVVQDDRNYSCSLNDLTTTQFDKDVNIIKYDPPVINNISEIILTKTDSSTPQFQFELPLPTITFTEQRDEIGTKNNYNDKHNYKLFVIITKSQLIDKKNEKGEVIGVQDVKTRIHAQLTLNKNAAFDDEIGINLTKNVTRSLFNDREELIFNVENNDNNIQFNIITTGTSKKLGITSDFMQVDKTEKLAVSFKLQLVFQEEITNNNGKTYYIQGTKRATGYKGVEPLFNWNPKCIQLRTPEIIIGDDDTHSDLRQYCGNDTLKPYYLPVIVQEDDPSSSTSSSPHLLDHTIWIELK